LSLSYKLIKDVILSGEITDFNNLPVQGARVFIDDKPVKVENNKYTVDLEDSHVYRLTVTAANLQTFIQEVTTGFTDINLPVKLQRIKTISVRVGVYISVNIPPPPITPTPTTRIPTTRIDPGGVVLRRGLTPSFASIAVRHDVATEFIRTTVPPVAPPPEKFSLMDNGNVSSSINDKAQPFNGIFVYSNHRRSFQHTGSL
jgi:hypothetical protein